MMSRRLLLACAVSVGLASVPSMAEDTPADTDTGVYVRDAAIVTERVALAERMERSKEWGKAADILQEVIEKNGQRIVPTADTGDSTPGIKRYIGATDLVQRRLAKWPADGLAAYNARFGRAAQALLDSAPSDPAVLGRVEADYFVTDAGKTAALRHIDFSLESGDFGSAAWTADRLIDLHPGLGDDRPAALFRAALAHHLAGDEQSVTKYLDELKAKYADATGTVAGQTVKWVDALTTAIAEAPPSAAQVLSDTWPTLGGDASRGRVPHATGQPGARLRGIDLTPPNLRNVGREQRMGAYGRGRPDADATGVMPVVDRGELFFQDGQRLFGVSVDSGEPLSGWMSNYPGTLEGRYSVEGGAGPGSARSRQLNVTVTDGSVLAIMGQGDQRLAQMMGMVSEGRLVCLDRKTGKQRWIVAPSKLPDEAMRSITLGGSPLVVGDNVYVTGRSAKQASFEDCYVLCFNLSDGKPKWTTYVSGASITNPNWGDAPLTSDNEAQVALSGGRLFVSTNLGAVAAIDAYNGGLIWLTTYPRGDGVGAFGPLVNPRMGRNAAQVFGQPGGGGTVPWAYNPPIVRDGHIFVAPTDGRDVLVFDAGDGLLEKRVLSRHLENADTFVGVVGDTLLLAGNNVGRAAAGGSTDAMVIGIDWRKYDASAFKTSSRPTPADTSVTVRRVFAESGTLRGRPFVTDTAMFIPTEKRLFCFDYKSNRVLDAGTYPAYPRTWDATDPDGEGPGNVLIVGDHVVIAGSQRVDIYTDLSIARARLDAKQDARPSDPEPRLNYAEVMFIAGEVPTAITKLDEAIALLGGEKNLRQGDNRDRLFNDALNFASKLTAGRSDSATTTQQANDLFDRAKIAADTSTQQVSYRIARAKLMARTRDFNNQVRLFQEILSDESMRMVPAVDEKNGPTSAGAVAEASIANLIATVGRQCYVAYDLVAEEKFNAARTAKDPAALLAVARQYPNSLVAGRTLVAAAETFESAGDHRKAAHVLRQAMRKDTSAAGSNTIVEAMARNYLAMPGGSDLAISLLSKQIRPDSDPRLSKPLKLPDGTAIKAETFMTALNELRPLAAAASIPVLPDLRLGTGDEIDPATNRRRRIEAFQPTRPQDVIAGVETMLVPEQRELTRSDRVVAWTGKSLAIYGLDSDKPLATYDVVKQQPIGVGWTGKDLIVWTTDTVWKLSPDDNGAVAWTVPVSGMSVLPPAPVETEDAPEETSVVEADMRRRRMLELRQRNLALRGGLAVRGIAAVEAPPPVPQPSGVEEVIDLRPVPSRVVLLTSAGRLVAIDMTTGELSWQARVATRGADRIEATDEFTVARTITENGSSLLIVDSFSGQVIWRLRFSAEAGTQLANFALSAEGTLVYTLADRLATKDLFEPWEGKPPNERIDDGGQGAVVFSSSTRPDQLVVGNGMAAALSGEGMVRIYSLLSSGAQRQQLATGSPDSDVSLSMVGSQLYTVSPKGFKSFDLVNPAPPDGAQPSVTDMERAPTWKQAIVGERHIVLFDTMGQAGGAAGQPGVPDPTFASPSYRIWAYSRERINGVENGRLDHLKIIADSAGISNWQAIDGGLVYHSADGKLHFLRGMREENAAQ